MKKLLGAVLAVALAATASACSSANARTDTARTAPVASAAMAIDLPSEILGLKVEQEDVSKQLKGIGASYLDSVALFGFRENKLLRAALQVGHFNSLASPDSASFRATVVQGAGTTVAEQMRVGITPVWLSPGQQQYTFIWFSGRWLYVLTARNDYPFSRTLLRKLMAATVR